MRVRALCAAGRCDIVVFRSEHGPPRHHRPRRLGLDV